MQRRPRRNHTPAFKAKVALAAIKDDRTLAQLAEQFDLHPNQITSWKAQRKSLLSGRAAGARSFSKVIESYIFNQIAEQIETIFSRIRSGLHSHPQSSFIF